MLKSTVLLCALVGCVLAQSESKYNEIFKFMNFGDDQLNADAQTYSASVADPSDYAAQGYSRASSERSRYSNAAPSANYKEEEAKKLEEEEEAKPDRLALLLADSKFTCENLKNGYYADETVGCQVFHYCVEGVKHSWQCPENTVFHQIHLNCVPNTQDICAQSSKFHIVNEYLHKELDERGPNNTVLYHQRFYPEGFDTSGGDTVMQIFAAQAQAALQKQRERQRQGSISSDGYSFEEEPVVAQPPPQPRPRASRPKAYNYNQASGSVRGNSQRQQVNSEQPVHSYKPSSLSRPVLIPATFSPSQPLPTKRPTLSFSTPEVFTPPTSPPSSSSYSETSPDVFSSSDYSSPSSSSSSSPSSSSSSSSSLSSFPSSSSSYQPSAVSSFGVSSSPSSPSSSPSSASSYSPSSRYRSGHSHSTSSSNRPTNYNTRSLGIPIASFRVAPSTSYAPNSQASSSAVASSASTVQEINVAPMLDLQSTANNPHLLRFFY